MSGEFDIVSPDPSALVESLRSVGYSLPTAIADIVDNSIAAGAQHVDIACHWAGSNSYVAVVDDGCGMTDAALREAMKPGSRSPLEERDPTDLGRFGLGLKTASFSQCRNLCVASKRQGGTLCVRTWDLDVLAVANEWRLLREPPVSARPVVERLARLSRGTAVVWTKLDRVTGGEEVSDATAHARFNDAVDHIRHHLALVYHRFLEEGDFVLTINNNAVEPWNPFMAHSEGVHSTEKESIPFKGGVVTFKGYVLPHKDMLSPEEYAYYAGPKGWNGQQGFYVYRNKRLLVYGSWLQLGRPAPWTREEHYRLARIRLDIGNNADEDWHLDVKKSVARPPKLLRGRLTDLGERVRATARRIFAHRGKFGKRLPTSTEAARPWVSRLRNNRRVYAIDREHPGVQAALCPQSDQTTSVESLLRLLEETVPVEQIWLDAAENPTDTAAPYAGLDPTVLRADMLRVYTFLTGSGINARTAKERLRTMEPFDRYPGIIDEL